MPSAAATGYASFSPIASRGRLARRSPRNYILCAKQMLGAPQSLSWLQCHGAALAVVLEIAVGGVLLLQQDAVDRDGGAVAQAAGGSFEKSGRGGDGHVQSIAAGDFIVRSEREGVGVALQRITELQHGDASRRQVEQGRSVGEGIDRADGWDAFIEAKSRRVAWRGLRSRGPIEHAIQIAIVQVSERHPTEDGARFLLIRRHEKWPDSLLVDERFLHGFCAIAQEATEGQIA
jgi:hypothetical protein